MWLRNFNSKLCCIRLKPFFLFSLKNIFYNNNKKKKGRESVSVKFVTEKTCCMLNKSYICSIPGSNATDL